MRIAAVILIVVALGFAGVTFFLVQNYLADQKADVTVPEGAAVEVIVASRDLPAGNVLDSSHLEWQPWPDDTNVEGYIVQRGGVGKEKLDELVGSVVRRAIATGEPITSGKVFKREEAGFLSGMLRPGMRAISIKVSAVSGAAGHGADQLVDFLFAYAVSLNDVAFDVRAVGPGLPLEMAWVEHVSRR